MDLLTKLKEQLLWLTVKGFSFYSFIHFSSNNCRIMTFVLCIL